MSFRDWLRQCPKQMRNHKEKIKQRKFEEKDGKMCQQAAKVISSQAANLIGPQAANLIDPPAANLIGPQPSAAE